MCGPGSRFSAHRVYLNCRTARDRLIVIAFDFFLVTGVTFALCYFSQSRYDSIIVMQVFTVDKFFAHTFLTIL